MKHTSRGQIVSLVGAVAALAILGATPAFAGFEWKGAPPAPPAPPAAPAPVMSSGGPLVVAAPVDSVIAAPVAAAPAGNSIVWTDEKSAAPVAKPAAAAEDVITGFGADLPLSVALKQVVPSSYKTVLAHGVKGDTKVSWSGDKPWRDVLTQMLASRNLSYALDGNTVTVSSGPAAKTAAAPAPVDKMDLVPADMISSGEKAAQPAPAPAKGPVSVTIRRAKPTSLVDKLTPSALSAKTVEPAPEAQPLHDITAGAEVAPHLSAQADQQMAAPSVVEPSWRAAKGETLHNILNDWSKAAHVDLYWSTDYDYRLNDTVAYGGNYNDAVGKLLDRFSSARPQPYGRLHRSPEGNTVLVVNTYDTAN